MIKEGRKSNIESLLTTTYEKVMKILQNVTSKLKTIGDSNLVEDMIYVINKIESKALYSYSQVVDSYIGSSDKESEEVKSLLDSLSEYSEHNFFRQNKKDNFITSAVKGRQGGRYKTQFQNNKEKVNFLDKIEEKLSNLTPKAIDKPTIELLTKNKSLITNKVESLDYIPSFYIEKYPEVMDKNFNIFEFYDKNKDNSFNIIFKSIIKKCEVDSLINCSKLDSFTNAVMEGYNNSPLYHNKLHGIDVCHMIFMYMNNINNFEEKLKFTKMNSLTLLLAALCHDIGHPGFTNNYHINSLSNFSLTYNDKSVLENYHASVASKILNKPECNIMDKFEKSEFKAFRRHFVEAILATDMMYHARTNSTLKSKLTSNNISNGQNIDSLVPSDEEKAFEVIQELINFILHLADISHNARKFEISEIWVTRLSEEFWIQGDHEKAADLPISFLCDRETANIPKSQIGFLKGIIVPSYEIMIDMFPDLNFLMTNIQENLEKWIQKDQITDKTQEQDQTKKRGKLVFNLNLKESKANTGNLSQIIKEENDEGNEEENTDKIIEPKTIFETKFLSINFDDTNDDEKV